LVREGDSKPEKSSNNQPMMAGDDDLGELRRRRRGECVACVDATSFDGLPDPFDPEDVDRRLERRGVGPARARLLDDLDGDGAAGCRRACEEDGELVSGSADGPAGGLGDPGSV
jgi:hypothetical protein